MINLFTPWAYRSKPSGESLRKREEKLQPLLWEQIKDQMNLDAVHYGSLPLVVTCRIESDEAEL